MFYINIYDKNFNLIKPSDLVLLYHINIFCNYYNFETNENIYSIVNNYENICFYCIEYKKIEEHAKFGIKIFKNELGEEIEFQELFFFLLINYLMLKRKKKLITTNSILIFYIKISINYL